MEKRLKRVQRWVDRCIEACRCKAWTSAVAELECARAELESASREIWEAALEGESSPRAGRAFVTKAPFLHALPVTVLILLLAVGPTSIESFNPAGPLVLETGPSVEWLTADERALLENFRKSLSVGTGANTSDPGGETVLSVPFAGRKARKGTPAEAVEQETGMQAVSPKGTAPIAAEDLLSLIQVGQRALRPEGESVRVERP